MKTLILNAGSSSIKYQLFDMPQQQPIARGSIERIGEEKGVIYHSISQHGETTDWQEEQVIEDHTQGLDKISELLLGEQTGVLQHPDDVFIVGHRVVHGGEFFREAVLITEEVEDRIEQLVPLAPLHNPPNLMGIKVARSVFPHAKQVAVFDTAFHQTMPDYAFRYPIPNSLYHEYHVRAYGMHGTSHRYVAHAAADHLQQPLEELNLITIHLGNGCSMAALQAGRSIDTSMGLTPLAGLMMGTRCGDIDPAIAFHLHREVGMDIEAIDELFNNSSGLKGITGQNDMRQIVRQYEVGDDDARLAIGMYAYRVKKYIGAYTAVLNRVDAIVFTGGVGENSALIRQHCCDSLTALGISIDQDRNNDQTAADKRAVHSSDSRVPILIIPTNEELSIAQQAFDLAK